MDHAAASLERLPGFHLAPADRRRFPTKVFLHDEALFVPLAIATAFGGDWDPNDSGATASGQRTDKPGGLVGCALPMPTSRACLGSPFPALPWGTLVEVTRGPRTVKIPLIDVGPAGGLPSEALIDLTKEAWELLEGKKLTVAQVRNKECFVTFRIPDVRKYLVDYWPRNADRVRPPEWPPRSAK